MSRISLTYKLLLFILIITGLSSCSKFNNPVELEPEGANQKSGTITVEVSGIAREATILVVDLAWTEEGASGENTWRKTLALTGKNPELSPDFDGLGPGIGYAVASTYVGTILYQQLITSENIQLDDGGNETISIVLTEADGDIDIDFDFEATDGDTTPTDGDKEEDTTDTVVDGDPEEDPDGDIEVDPKLVTLVEYSPVESDMNGLLNIKDNLSTWDEWTISGEQNILTNTDSGTTFYFMQDSSLLQIGVNAVNFQTVDSKEDRIGVAIDLDLEVANDEFILYVQRESNIITCEPLVAASCKDIYDTGADLPKWDAKVSPTGDGWQVEIFIEFESLFLIPDTPRKFGMALISQNNGTKYRWPYEASTTDPATWGELVSPDDWGTSGIIDGDDDTIDGDNNETDIDIVDGDEDEDLDIADGDIVDVDPEPDLEEDSVVQICTPNEIKCELQGSVPHAITCNNDGTEETDEACNQYTQCVDHKCSDGLGCYFQDKVGDACDDGIVCTENDTCSGGSCSGDVITCNEYECKDRLAPTATECCVYANKPNGGLCGSASECDIPVCDDGFCVPGIIEGCCVGHPDMIKVTESHVDYCIDKYEAIVANTTLFDNGCESNDNGTRYGESSDDYPAGWPDDVDNTTEITLKACNNPGHIPSSHLTYFQAEKACAEVGKRLCTSDEFMKACGSAALQSYPYGDVYNASTCNGENTAVEQCGANASCERYGIYDLSGNLAEWTKTGTADPQVCGGHFQSTQSELACTTSCTAMNNMSSDINIGFRCCIYAPME